MDAKIVLLNAVQCDREGRILEAQNSYQEGIQILMNLVSGEHDMTRKKAFLERINDYMQRAEQIKERVKNHMQQGQLLENFAIEDDATGFSYKTIFGKYLKSDVNEILLEEPYITEKYQFQNLIMFLELCVKNCPNLKYVHLITKTDPRQPIQQLSILENIKDDLLQRHIKFYFKFEDTLHDRKIVLSTGYIIKIGRGLNIFKACNPLYSLGLNDYDFRKCLQTDVYICRTKSLSN